MAKLVAWLAGLSFGAQYALVLVLMALQSACVPLPSEVIMPFAGAALAHTQAQLVLLATLAALASNVGSIPAYWLGAKGGRPMVERFGRFLLLSRRDLDMAEKFFARYGDITVLLGRMLPIVRTFIALPAGIARMNQVRFHAYTFIGSWPWCYALAYAGYWAEKDPARNAWFHGIFHRFQVAIEVAIAVAIIVFVWTHWKNRMGATEAA